MGHTGEICGTKVSLQTLIERGLQEHYFAEPTTKGRSTVRVRSTAEVRCHITGDL